MEEDTGDECKDDDPLIHSREARIWHSLRAVHSVEATESEVVMEGYHDSWFPKQIAMFLT